MSKQLLSVRIWIPVYAAASLIQWVHVLRSSFHQFGLFRWIGADFALYYVQGLTFRIEGPAAIYNLGVLGQHLQSLAPYARPSTDPLQVGLVPYPPIFAWLFTVLTHLSPVASFVVWTALNAMAALYLARRVSRVFPPAYRLLSVLLLLVSYPVMLALTLGQPTILLACGVAECFLSLREGKEFRAGLWLIPLMFKPIFGVLIGVILLWKCRWSAVFGATLGLIAITLGSALVAGPESLRAYFSLVVPEGSFRGLGTNIFPEQMVNWRSLILITFPRVPDSTGIVATLILSALTALAVLYCWKGPWNAAEAQFSVGLTALFVATLLASYHSHPFDLVLLALPLAVTLATGPVRQPTRLALLALVVIPNSILLGTTLLGRLGVNVSVGISPLAPGLLLVCLTALLAEMVRRRQDAEDAVVDVAQQVQPIGSARALAWPREP